MNNVRVDRYFTDIMVSEVALTTMTDPRELVLRLLKNATYDLLYKCGTLDQREVVDITRLRLFEVRLTKDNGTRTLRLELYLVTVPVKITEKEARQRAEVITNKIMQAVVDSSSQLKLPKMNVQAAVSKEQPKIAWCIEKREKSWEVGA